ncbi:MAG TPA: metallophosphoesterase family protein [Kofleriaceae bacterium]|nr:metallophosphoesterase family protein [Kofleriaceae bacterium]
MPAVPYAADVIDLLLTVGYIDGVFHERERAFVHHYLESLIEKTENAAPAIGIGIGMGMGIGIGAIAGNDRGPFDDLFDRLEQEIAILAQEVTPAAHGGFVPTRLKVRALTIFAKLPPEARGPTLELVRALIAADGMIAAPEHDLFEELSRYFATAASTAAIKPSARPMQVTAPLRLRVATTSHPLLDPIERAYPIDANERTIQVAHDHELAVRSIAAWRQMRANGHGKLDGITDVAQLPAGAEFLDGHVHVLRPDRPTELIVLGDLHGCYACLKAAIMQSGFLDRAVAHQQDPRNPPVKLVFLGDYIDRGKFGMDGVLRAVLRLFLSFPEDVIVLRGNHEYFISFPTEVKSAVAPAETIASVAPHVPRALLETYCQLFEEMPTSYLVDRTLFVHGGIPRDDTFAQKFRDLSSLDDPEIRFQMMWSDPAQTDRVPVALQRQNPRFNFGRQQFTTFMQRAGLKTMIRGHDKIETGFDVIYDGDPLLLNLFSAGGDLNDDLPPGASYRSVTPMAMTIEHSAKSIVATPWPIDWQSFNVATHNGFRRLLPSIPFIAS